MKKNYNTKIIFLGCLVFGLLSFGLLVKPLPTLAGNGSATLTQPCVTSPTDSCIQGLNCVSSVCVDPNAGANPTTPVNPTNPTTPSPATCTQGSCPTGLCSVNNLCLPPQQYTTGLASSTSLTGFLLSLIKILLSFAGVIAVVMLVLGGYWYMAAGGNEEMSEKGRKTIINFVLGLVIIILAYTIVTVISSTLTGADKLLK
jgi:type IV secretory pathway VirB2 component (pilin)